MLNRKRSINRVSELGVLVIIMATSVLTGSTVLGQDETRVWGQFFGGVGAITDGEDVQGVMHFGGGGEGLLAGGFGVTAELGYLANIEGFSGGIGVFSAGGMYAFNRDRKTVPFVNGGYTLFFREGSENGFFFGGGVNHWIGESWGIRIEGRDQVMAGCTDVHTIEARVAIVLR
jgi:hypothetical protein